MHFFLCQLFKVYPESHRATCSKRGYFIFRFLFVLWEVLLKREAGSPMVPTEWFGPQFKVVPWQPKWDSFYQRILYCSTLNVFASFGNCTIFSFFLLFVALSCGSFIHFGIRHRIEREGRKESVSTYKDTVYRNMSGGFLLFNNFNIDVVSVSRILCNIVLHQCHNCLTLSGVTME